MPEGDSLYKVAAMLRCLVGGAVHRLESPLPGMAEAVERAPGMRVAATEARGKNLLIWLGPGGASHDETAPTHAIYSHLRMTGSWHLYRPDSDWQKPGHRTRAMLDVSVEDGTRWHAVCFSAPVVEWLTAFQVRQHPVLSRLGPDMLADALDIDAIIARLRVNGHRAIGDAIMDQRLVAGIGNVYKSELLFIERLDPFAPIDAFDDDTLRRFFETARTWMRRNLGPGRRRTRWDTRGKRTWVYDKSGDPCGHCGEPIRMTRQGDLGRSTYYCPRCQEVAARGGRGPRRRGRIVVRGAGE